MGDNRLARLVFAVNDLDAGARHFQRVFGATEIRRGALPDHQLVYAILSCGGWHVEVVQPTAPESAVAKSLAKRGEGLYAVAIGVRDLEQASADLAGRGASFVTKRPLETPEGRTMVLHPGSTFGLMLELVEEPR